eukprot:1196306-Prorocentrum_minimum.AAC.3
MKGLLRASPADAGAEVLEVGADVLGDGGVVVLLGAHARRLPTPEAALHHVRLQPPAARRQRPRQLQPNQPPPTK